MGKIFVTQSGYESLLKKKKDLESQLRSSQFDKGRAAAGDSNSWHDNAEFEMHARNEMILAKQVAEIICEIEESRVVGLPKNNSILAIGHVATLRSDNNVVNEYVVAGFGETDLTTIPKKVSYDSPMITQFLKKSVGFSASVIVRGEPVVFTLEKIK